MKQKPAKNHFAVLVRRTGRLIGFSGHNRGSVRMHFPTELLSHDQYKQQASMLKLASRLDLKHCNTVK